MTRARVMALLGALAVLALIGIGLAQLASRSQPASSSAKRLTPAQTSALLAGSPPVLAALHSQAGQLLGGGGSSLHARLSALKGYPIVINKWASWCVPCREELTAFANVSARFGRRVAFLGLDSGDSGRSDALAFLRAHPVSYPSYYDKSGELGEQITDSSFTPVTVFIPLHGRPYIHQGQYPSVKKLEEDVRSYALGT